MVRFKRRVSLRMKVLAIFLGTVSGILLLSNCLYYLSTKSILVRDAKANNQMLSKEIGAEIEQASRGVAFVDHVLGEKLRAAAIAAKYALSPNAANVTPQQLRSLSKELGVNDITLFQPVNGDIVAVKSSDPGEVGINTKSWSQWSTAFAQLWKDHNVTIPFGEASQNFWTGPWANANSHPDKVEKWGYFYDGSTNYIIDPYVQDTSIKAYEDFTGPSSTMHRLLQTNPQMLEITEFNPNTFGKKPVVFNANGKTWVDIKSEPFVGTYNYADSHRDVNAVRTANQTHATVSFKDTIKGRTVLKTFVPINTDAASYVLGFVTEYSQIQNVLDAQLRDSLAISAALLVLVCLVSIYASRYIVKPLQRITKQVEQLAETPFAEPVSPQTKRNDEIGDLANQVTVMSHTFAQYAQEMHESIRRERSFGMSFLGMVTMSLLHELRHPLVAIRNMIEFFPRVQPFNEKGQDVLNHIQSANDHVNRIVHEFSDFINKGKLNLTICDVADIAVESLQMMSSTAEKERVDLNFENENPSDGLFIQADKDKIRQVLLNLVANGIESIDTASPRRVVTLSVRGTSRDEVQIDILDSGHGIPKDKWKTVFAPFNSTKEGGLGLGLALSSFIILSSGGTIGVARSDGAGTVIRITLPRTSPDSEGVSGPDHVADKEPPAN